MVAVAAHQERRALGTGIAGPGGIAPLAVGRFAGRRTRTWLDSPCGPTASAPNGTRQRRSRVSGDGRPRAPGARAAMLRDTWRAARRHRRLAPLGRGAAPDPGIGRSTYRPRASPCGRARRCLRIRTSRPLGAGRGVARRGGHPAGRSGSRELRPPLLPDLRSPADMPRRAGGLACEPGRSHPHRAYSAPRQRPGHPHGSTVPCQLTRRPLSRPRCGNPRGPCPHRPTCAHRSWWARSRPSKWATKRSM